MNPRMGEEPVLAELKAGLRAGGPDFAAAPREAREVFEQTLAMIPVPDDVAFGSAELGGVRCVTAHFEGAAPDGALLYLHGGAYIAGSAHGYRVLAANLGRAAGLPVFAADYRLAPEDPFPAAIKDCCKAYRALLAQGIEPGRIALAGDSAGGGLAVATLLALRDAGDPLPAAAVAISPWADLSCSGASIAAKQAEDASLTPHGLAAGAAHYLGDANPRDPLASPIFADLSRLPPLLVQVGSSEILLDDAASLARNVGAAGSPVRLDIWPGMPHVWHAFGFMLEAGRLAVEDAGDFIRAAMD